MRGEASRSALLQVPMAGYAIIRNTLHLMGANLDFRQLIIQAEDCRMQRLIAIQLGRSNKVFYPSIFRTPQRMDMPQSQIAIVNRVYQDTVGDEIMNLAELTTALLQFTIDA